MRKVKIIEATEYNYVLLDDNNHRYTINMGFYNVEAPKVGDLIYLSDKLLNEEILYNFGPFNNNMSEDDIIKVVSGNNEYYLQRYYG